MATGPKIVHKQFNSPIGLYSQRNIQDTLNKHLSNLDNGGVGIDFNNPSTDKPGNLAHSAVLRMLEEEEHGRRRPAALPECTHIATRTEAIKIVKVHATRRFDSSWPPQRMISAHCWDGLLNANGHIHTHFMKHAEGKGQKKVVWPPVPETNGYHQTQQQQSPAYNAPPPSARQPQYQTPSQPQYSPQPQSNEPQYQQQNQPQYQQQHQPQYQQQNQPAYQQNQLSHQQNRPSFADGRRQEATGLSKLIPVGPGYSASPAPPYRQGPPSPVVAQPYKQPTSRWAPVPAPLSPQAYPQQQPQYNQQYSPNQYPQQYSPQPEQPPQYSPPEYPPQYEYQPPQRQFEPPPATIQLRQQQPVHQQPPPVFSSQPATASYQGGVNMRGDQKWPPQSVKEAVQAENEARMQLAKGPACRPRKVKKDYSSFFAAHALNQNYPGYRVPPGTQHYEDHSGRSSY